MSEHATRETLGFQAEVRQLLQLMIHSLYSNKEIFLRELISNASDAADKLRFAALASPELLGNDPDLRISVTFDADARTISVRDNGIGMSREELVGNLGTIARSGTAEFLKQMTGDEKKDAKLIGQFGVGFYSSFIVADNVEVVSRRAGAQPGEGVHWESDGKGEFSVSPLELEERGTTVTLHLKPGEAEFLDENRLERLIRKYSDHIAFPVTLSNAGADEGSKAVNTATALWTRSRTEIEDDEYREFYKHLSHDFADPLAWSHNRVEGRREYVSLLYIPSAAPFDLWNRDAPRGLKLYVQRVFIMDDAEQFLPLYLRFVKGVIDSADLPLNVSRELLQSNSDLDAMRSALTRRVLDMLQKMAADDPDSYQRFWDEFGQTVKEGLVEDPSNREKLLKLSRFSSTRSSSAKQDVALDDYVSRMPENQNAIYLLVADTLEHARSSPHLEALTKRGLEVLLLHDRIDPWLLDQLTEYDGKEFQDIGRGRFSLPDGDGQLTQEAVNDANKPLLKKIRQVLKDRVETVNASRRLVDSAACVVTQDSDLGPQLRRMLEASGQSLPELKPILEINVDHPLIRRLSREADEGRFSALSAIVLDHALLAEGTPIANPADYVRRMNELLINFEKDVEPT